MIFPSGHADQSSGRLQVDWKHEDVLKTSWCLLQGYVSIKWYILQPLVTSSTRHVHKTTRRPPEDQSSWRLQNALEDRRCIEDVLMPSSKPCHYQIKYFKAPLVTSSTRHVHMTTRRPPEDQSSWRLQVDLKHAYVLKTYWRIGHCYVTMKLNILKAPW